MQGVAVCMNAEMQHAWRAAGRFCRYEGGRLLHVKLLLHGRVVNVVAVYAPTFNTEAAEKDAFYDKLREMLDTVRSGEEVFKSWVTLMHEWVPRHTRHCRVQLLFMPVTL